MFPSDGSALRLPSSPGHNPNIVTCCISSLPVQTVASIYLCCTFPEARISPGSSDERTYAASAPKFKHSESRCLISAHSAELSEFNQRDLCCRCPASCLRTRLPPLMHRGSLSHSAAPARARVRQHLRVGEKWLSYRRRVVLPFCFERVLITLRHKDLKANKHVFFF